MLYRQGFIRPERTNSPRLDAYGMSGIFGKLVKAIAKPFNKVFKPHTLLGKLTDPLGLNSRNMKSYYKAADIVGTVAAVVVGGWAVGAAAGAAGGGFWATAGAGAKIVGGGALKALSAAKGAVVGGAKIIAPIAVAEMAKKPEAAPVAAFDPVTQGDWGKYAQNEIGGGGGFSGGGSFSGGGGGGPIGTYPGSEMPGATVEVNDAMPKDGPPWLLIGAGAVALYLIMKKK